MSEIDPHAQDRQELRATMRAFAVAINSKDWDALRTYLDAQAMITMIDQTTLHGPDDLARYVESKLGAFSAVLSDLQVDPVPDGPATFHGDIAIATLTSADRFIFRNGKEIMSQNRYTAMLRKTDYGWKLLALHGGANAFNNPISYQAHGLLLGGAVAAGVVGLVVGAALGRK